MGAFTVVRDFERAVAEYTGAPYCVTVNSCTSALLLAVAWHITKTALGTDHPMLWWREGDRVQLRGPAKVEIPKRTYVSVPMSIIHAGARPVFREEDWQGQYQLSPLPIWDAARRFTKGMYCDAVRLRKGLSGIHHFSGMACVSFHWSKILGIQQGGAILHDSPEADIWLRRARFDGRTEGVAPKDDEIMLGWHCYMSPEVAAEGLVRLHFLPDDNPDLPNDDYPDLSEMEIFK